MKARLAQMEAEASKLRDGQVLNPSSVARSGSYQVRAACLLKLARGGCCAGKGGRRRGCSAR